MNIGLQGKVQNHPNHRSGACTRFLPASKLRSIFGRMEGHDGRKTPPASLWAQVLIQALFLWNCKKRAHLLDVWLSQYNFISCRHFHQSFCLLILPTIMRSSRLRTQILGCQLGPNQHQPNHPAQLPVEQN